MKSINCFKTLVTLFLICIASCQKAGEDLPKPIASFTLSKTSAALNEVVTFTNTSQNATTYEWDFGDGNNSTVKNPTHSYSTIGVFTITLSATGEGGNNSASKTITIIIPAPVAGFTIDKTTAEGGELITFTNTSQNATSYAWDFGDGSTSTSQNVTHSYSDAGTYAVELTAIGEGGTNSTTNTVTIKLIVKDIENNQYNTVKIGTQIWMSENLRVTKLNDGSAISNVTENVTWESMVTPAYCWYENNYATYGIIHGALYNFYAVSSEKLCPAGWHIPSIDEWEILIAYLGGEIAANSKMKSTEGWELNANGTNESGFNAFPGGFRYQDGAFIYTGWDGNWWSSNPFFEDAYYYNIRVLDNGISQMVGNKSSGCSVRCIKD
jgi:uncharacterized protein (TIGR02145 family)